MAGEVPRSLISIEAFMLVARITTDMDTRPFPQGLSLFFFASFLFKTRTQDRRSNSKTYPMAVDG